MRRTATAGADGPGAEGALTAARRTRVAIASPDPALRLQLRRLLPRSEGYEIVGSTRFGEQLRDALARYRPDALIVDARDEQAGAADALELARRGAGRVVVLYGSSRPGPGLAAAAIRCPEELAPESLAGPFARGLHSAVRAAAPPEVFPGGGALRALAPAPELIAFGSSTGGPPALLEVFRGLRGTLRLPVLVTQHMPPRFTGMLAQQIAQAGPPAHEAEQGMPLEPGHVYVAPGGQHLTVQRRARQLICTLDDSPPENYCKPSVDVMLRSVARACHGRALAVILTGMGSDGLQGGCALVQAGGTVIAQDEASSVVWGMPGAVAMAGLCHAVLPLGEIAAAVGALTAGGG